MSSHLLRPKFTILAWAACLCLVGATRSSGDDQTGNLAVLVAAIQKTDNDNVRRALLQGMLRGLSGRRNLPAPDGWSTVSDALKKSDDDRVRELTEELSQVFGDPEAMGRAVRILRDGSAKLEARRAALKGLLAQRYDIGEYLVQLLDERDLRIDAIRGFSIIAPENAAQNLISRYSEFNSQEKRAVVETLATRKVYAEKLITAIKSDIVSREEIPAYIARSLRDIVGEDVTRVFGEIRELKQNTTELIANYKKIITPESLAKADVSHGRAVFQKTCAACHVMYGEGGKIGPDLTGSNRANLDYILLNSLAPSDDVPAGYRMVVIATDDGRVLSGVIGEEDEQRLVLKTVEQPSVVIVKEEIVSRKVSEKSMMPDGQLQQLKTSEVVDLIRYLRTTEQVELPNE